MKRLIATLLVLLTQLGLRAADLPASVFINLKGDWGDADLKVASVEKKDDGSVVIVATAEYGKESMGFRVVLSPKWETWRPKELNTDLYRGVVRLESIGKPSEIFIQCLAKAYRQKIERIDFSGVELAAISLGGDPRLVRNEPVKLKVFFESEKEEAYAEAYLNFDLPHSLVQFHEKDPEYRKPVLGFFTRGKVVNQVLQSKAALGGEKIVVTTPAGRKERVTRQYTLKEIEDGTASYNPETDAPAHLKSFSIQHPVYPQKQGLEDLQKHFKAGDQIWYFQGLDSGWVIVRDGVNVWVLVTNHEY